MTSRDSRFTDDVIAAIAGGASINDAASEVGVSRRTVSRIVNSPDGKAALAELRAVALDHAATRLLGLVDAAADTLADVMADTDAGASARVAAARAVLAHAVSLRELTELESRLGVVEQRLAAAIVPGRRLSAVRGQ